MKDFARIAVASPVASPACPARNMDAALAHFVKAAESGADAVVLPELCLSGFTCGDLFFTPSLLSECEEALRGFAAGTARRPATLAVVGLPVRIDSRLFDCAAVVAGGRLLGVVPKMFPQPVEGTGDGRWFASGADATVREITLSGFSVPFGTDLLFETANAVYGIEIGDDLLAPVAPSSRLALAGADAILNPCATPAVAGSAQSRRNIAAAQSARCIAACAYANAGTGESTTDFVFDGDCAVLENGETLAEGGRFERTGSRALADVDTGYLRFARSRSAAFRGCVPEARRVAVPGVGEDAGGRGIIRDVEPLPFVPRPEEMDARCSEMMEIMSAALAKRLETVGCSKVVLGLSGGLDSTLAMIVSVEAFKRLGLDRSGIRAFTLPGFGTTSRTKGNAEKLCEAFGIPIETIDIAPMARLHLADLGRDETEKDVTYENAQARGRTYILMDKANQLGALLVGTGDLSELALGWCTYNGDHMSMYCVNGGVPKTLVRRLVEWYAGKREEARDVLLDILATPVSPELLPAAADGTIAQRTEGKIGPYELHDFFLWHFIVRGAGRAKIAALALKAFEGKYGEDEIAKWLDLFFSRFRTQQYKRSCMPDGPKVVAAGLSPRGGWAMPSDIGRDWKNA